MKSKLSVSIKREDASTLYIILISISADKKLMETFQVYEILIYSTATDGVSQK